MTAQTPTAAIFARIAAAFGLGDQADAAAYAAPTYTPTSDTGEQDLHEVARVTEAQLQNLLSELAFGREGWRP